MDPDDAADETGRPAVAVPSEPADAEVFFDGDVAGLAALAWVESRVNDCGGAELRTAATQIGWARRRGFATLWSPRRATGHGVPWALTIHLSHRLDSPRWKQVVQVRPGLWVHHLELDYPDVLDAEVGGWIRAACDDASHVTVVDPGPSAILTDEGRPGWAHLAATTSGAFDRRAYQLANRLVGNSPGAAVIEFLLGPLTLRFHVHATVAVGGADAEITVRTPAGRIIASTSCSTIDVPRGAALVIGRARSGLRGYLAVRGGWDIRPILGSRSLDTLSGLGPQPLRSGAGLPIGPADAPFPAIGHAPLPVHPAALDLRLLPGPRDGALLPAGEALADLVWTVSSDSDRIGVRLAGPELPVSGQLRSEPLVRGAVQVPPDGQPVIMGPDHPTTGGYPVIGVVAEADVDLLAQARPGTIVRMRPVPGA